MYAVIESDGKQVRVSEGDVIRCDLVNLPEGSPVTFERVVLAGDGSNIHVGTPVIAGAKVSGTVVRQSKDPKILVFKYKPKKRVRKLVGHRQRRAIVKIERIALP